MSNEDIFNKANLDSQDFELQRIYKDMASDEHTEPKTTFHPKSSSKSAFTPIKSRSEIGSSFAPQNNSGSTPGSAFVTRQNSFGASGSRGVMKKDQLSAQIKSFLGSDEPPVDKGQVMDTGYQPAQHRKLPKSPENEREPSPDNERHSPIKERSRSRNSNSSPLRLASKPPIGGELSATRPGERNGRSPPDLRKKRPGSASRIPTPSSLNANNAANNGPNSAGTSINPSLTRRNSFGATGGTKIPTPVKRPASLTVDDHQNSSSPKNVEELATANEVQSRDEPDCRMSHPTSITSMPSDLLGHVALASKGQEEDEVTTSLSSGANDQRRSSSVIRNHSPDNRSGVTIMPTIPATPKTPKTPLKESSHHYQPDRPFRASVVSPKYETTFEYENENVLDCSTKEDEKNRVPDFYQENRSQDESFRPSALPSRTKDFRLRRSASDVSGSSYIPTESYRQFLQNKKFRSKHSDLLNEAYDIIGKYFPEKRMFAHSFYSSTSEGPGFEPNPGQFLHGHGLGVQYSPPMSYTPVSFQPQPRFVPRLTAHVDGMRQPIVYLVPGSTLPSHPQFLRHRFGSN